MNIEKICISFQSHFDYYIFYSPNFVKYLLSNFSDIVALEKENDRSIRIITEIKFKD